MAAGRRLLTSGRFRPTATPILRRPGLTITLLAVLLGLAIAPAHAQLGSDRYASIVIDAATGRVLSAVNPDAERHPASLTKMMTLYMVFEALRDRRIRLDEQVPVSAHAASMEPTKLGLVPGTRITVEQAILGIVTRSANDAAVALGELLGGGEDRFANMMTLRARALGMEHTEYHNASGLPNPDQWTTARDLALLARHLLHDFPVEYRYFATTSFRFHNHLIVGHDNLLISYPGADGIKTGFTDASGYNLVTSALHGQTRLIGVVLGEAHAGPRDLQMEALLNQGFADDGGPVVMARRDAPHRFIAANLGLIASAHAATLPPARPMPAKWSIRIGVFPSEAAARRAAATAQRLTGSGYVAVTRIAAGRHTTWRAQIIGLSVAEAHGACGILARHRLPCAMLRPDASEFASR
jgi:D-alanyl-D-alanine carboxypeptidase